MLVTSNPLFAPQRETAGASTFGKYGYQYHWALCRVLRDHQSEGDYIVIIEHHEDVVIANSTDSTHAKFEFNQIKEISGSAYTPHSLTKRKKKKEGLENSILGKMMLGVEGRPFKSKIEKLNLVASCGFSIPQLVKDTKLEVLTIGDITADAIQAIQKALEHEVGIKEFPKTLTFITPDLPSQGYEDNTVGRISQLVEKLYPGSKYNPVTIYRMLIDELCRKGKVTFDYADWDQYVKNKGLTKAEIGKSIAAYTDPIGLNKLDPDFNDICQQLNLQFPRSSNVRRAYERYHNAQRFDRSLFTLDIQSTLKTHIQHHYSQLASTPLPQFIKDVLSSMPSDITDKLNDPDTLLGAVIYALIMRSYED